MDNNFQQNNPYVGGYGAPVMYPNQFQPAPMMTPSNQNALSQDEIAELRSAHPGGQFVDLKIERVDLLRSMCCHKENGRDVVYQVQDGSGDVYCPICGERWSPAVPTQDDVINGIQTVIDFMQNVKWMGDLPANAVREYFTMIPLLKKFPDLFNYSSKTLEKMVGGRGYTMAGDGNLYRNYDALFGAGPVMGGYGQMPMYGQPGGYYAQPQYGQQPQTQYASTMNPMQAGYAPTYGQPVQPQTQYVPQYGQQYAPQYGGQPAAAPQTMTTTVNPAPQPAAPPTPAPADNSKKPAKKSNL